MLKHLPLSRGCGGLNYHFRPSGCKYEVVKFGDSDVNKQKNNRTKRDPSHLVGADFTSSGGGGGRYLENGKRAEPFGRVP